MLNFILCENFISKNDIFGLHSYANDNEFVEKKYGQEIQNQNYILQNAEQAFASQIGKPVTLIKQNSGIFRKPQNCLIHFEESTSFNDWCFACCLEESTFNLHTHKSGAKSSLEQYNLNYRYLPDWNYYLNCILKPGDAVFYRPWLFHSFENGLIYYYNMKTE